MLLQAVPPPDFNVYELRVNREVPIAAAGSTLLIVYLLLDHDARPDPCAVGGSGCDPSQINGFDRFAVDQSSRTAEVASDYTRAATVVTPLVIDALMMREPYSGRGAGFMNDLLLEGEVVGLTSILTQLIEDGTDRLRPYAYRNTGLPAGTLRDAADFTSFPSGHTSMSFSAATFGCYTYVRRARPTFARAALWCSPGFALAATTGILRVAAGRHYPTDVIAGAALGIGVGLGIPMIHRDARAWNWTVVAVPSGAGLGINGLF